MNSNIRNLKRRLLQLRQSQLEVYLKFQDGSIYRTVDNSNELIQVNNLPSGANVEYISANKDDLNYIYGGTYDNEPINIVVLNVSEAKEQGIL